VRILLIDHTPCHSWKWSVNNDNYDLVEFVDTLVVALREVEKAEAPTDHIHPVILKDWALSAVEGEG